MAVLGAAGGVGLAAVELAALLGAEVVAVASTEEKRAACLEQGARVALPYRPWGPTEQPVSVRTIMVALP
ncbi:zinc-binding dehydrogenase [Streptomyces sp. NBC_01549]|uniref:zinc-binding dehydrogenase n=1 Tax=Streptomyces sp. NBC_01549 TaxID=2975874 RepID=UPI0022536B5C|nr:zinc-binding dehydrogenase [Streptomyces sp. NBC_01549]MCX4595170.1 zinc-binding dehydrogenase [Streptomyces sp. NBC_01549]